MRRRLPQLSPRAYTRLAWAAMFMVTAVVLTGAGVRLSDSGLGCPDWPQCHGGVIAPADTHAWIEYGNRLFSALVGVVALVAFAGSFLRTPRRRDLIWISALLPLGCLAQGVLGAITVLTDLAPEVVMSHFGLSMLLLAAAVALVWRARMEPSERPPGQPDRPSMWATRALVPIAAITLLAGMISTASGPHAGDPADIRRLDFRGAFTMEWAIEWHGYLAWALGIGAIAVWALAWWRGANITLRRWLTVLCLMIGLQGLVGVIQYAEALPAEIVWIHVTLAALTWIALLWSVAAASQPATAADQRSALAAKISRRIASTS